MSPLSALWLHQLAASTSYCRCPRLLRFPSVRPRRSSLSPLITPSVLPLWMRLLAVLDVMCAADRRRLCLCHGGSFLNQVRRLLKDLNYRGKPHQTCNHTHLCSHGLHTNHAASHVMSGFFFFVMRISLYLRLGRQVQTRLDIKLIYWETLEDKILYFHTSTTLPPSKPFNSVSLKTQLEVSFLFFFFFWVQSPWIWSIRRKL